MRRQEGFLIIEVLFALGLVAVLAMLTLPLLNKRETIIQRVEIRQLALQIARSELEEIRASGSRGNRNNLSPANQAMLRHLPQASGQVLTEPFAKGLTKIQVLVSWRQGQGRHPQTISLTSLVR